MRILITGCAGFIGHQLSVSLAKRGEEVVGIDNLNNYYNPALKLARLGDMGVDIANGKSNVFPNFRFINSDIADNETLNSIFAREKFDVVCNLAAQAGVRYSIDHPRSYIESNVVGFFNILECCRYNGVGTLVYASSSSVYGGNTKTPFCEEDRVDNPKSLYAATKKSDELMARVYSSLRNKHHGAEIFHGIWPMGTPGYVAGAFCKRYHATQTYPPFQRRRHGARFHVYR